jgi:anti-sigma factor (TIGR02949 family)
MSACEVFLPHVDAVVDGEVDPQALVGLERHLAHCPECRAEVAFRRTLKRHLRADAGRTRAPLALRSKLTESLDLVDEERGGAEGSRPARSARYVVPATAAAVALAVLAAQEGGGLPGVSEPDESPPAGFAAVPLSAAPVSHRNDPTPRDLALRADDYFSDVIRRHDRSAPPEVRGAPMDMSRWFRGKLDFRVTPIELPRAELVGGRLSNVREREAATLYYEVDGRRVTVVVFEPPVPLERLAERADVAGNVYFREVRGHTVPVVERGGLGYAFVGDLDRRTLLRLASEARLP